MAKFKKRPEKEKTEVPRLYRKKHEVLVEDCFDWANPKASKVVRPLLLHGTSKSLISRIKEEGLVYKCPLLTPEELAALKRHYDGSEIESSIGSSHMLPDVLRGRRLSLTLSPSLALKHAIDGPEVLSRISIKVKWDKALEEPIPGEILQIESKIDEFYSNHAPVILLVDCPIYQPDYDMLEKLKRREDSNKDPALSSALIYLSTLMSDGFTEKEAIQLSYAEYSRDSYVAELLPDDTVIPPEDIKAVIEVTDELKV